MNLISLSTAARLSNEELLTTVKHLAEREREVTADLIAHLAELDERRLYLAEGCSSLFTYCVQVLHLSEHAAYGRIVAARASRKFPVILERLNDGSVNLTTICLLVAYAAGGSATAENIELRCRAHNGYQAEREFGRRLHLVAREPHTSYTHTLREIDGCRLMQSLRSIGTLH